MGRGVQKEYGENEQVVAYIIGDLRSVPGFIPKRFIRSQLKKNPPPVKFLLDWKGGDPQTVSNRRKETDALSHLAGRHNCVPPKSEFQGRNSRRTEKRNRRTFGNTR